MAKLSFMSIDKVLGLKIEKDHGRKILHDRNHRLFDPPPLACIWIGPMEKLNNKFHAYFVKVHQAMVQHVFATLENPDLENFHQLRIATKRIRFVGAVLRRFGSKKIDQLIKPYRKLFRQAGKIRQYHVYTALVARHAAHAPAEAFTRHFAKAEKELLKKWPDQVSRFMSANVHSYPRLLRAIRRWNTTEEEFVHTMTTSVRERFLNPIPVNRMHDSRKLLKEMLYSCEVSPLVRQALNREFHLRIAILLEDAIGDWHDLDLALQHSGAGKGRSRYKAQEHLQREKERELQKIRMHIPRLIKQT
jgi:CHAD domain-containing protein